MPEIRTARLEAASTATTGVTTGMDISKKQLKRSSTNETPERRHTVSSGQSMGLVRGEDDGTKPLSSRKGDAVEGARNVQNVLSSTHGKSESSLPSPRQKKRKSFYGSLRIHAHGSKPDVDSPETRSTSPRSRLHSPRGKKVERAMPVDPQTGRPLIDTFRQLDASLHVLLVKRSRLDPTRVSRREMDELKGEAEDLRVQHEIVTNKIYDGIGIIKAFNDHKVVHWTEWPLSELKADRRAEDSDSISPRRSPRAEPLASHELPMALRDKLQQSQEDEIRSLIASSSASIEASSVEISKINEEGKSIDQAIAGLNRQLDELIEKRAALMQKKKRLLADRSLSTRFVESAESELETRRVAQLQVCSNASPSAPLSPRSARGADQ